MNGKYQKTKTQVFLWTTLEVLFRGATQSLFYVEATIVVGNGAAKSCRSNYTKREWVYLGLAMGKLPLVDKGIFFSRHQIGANRRFEWQVYPLESNVLIVYLVMASSQTSVWDHAFSFPQSVVCKFLEITKLLSKVKFDGESKIDSLGHLHQFNKKCLSLNVSDQGDLCRFFVETYKGRIKNWFEGFTIGSIHSWEKFM